MKELTWADKARRDIINAIANADITELGNIALLLLARLEAAKKRNGDPVSCPT